MQLITVRHVTTYRYKQPVSFGEHRLMFRPRDSYDQKLIEASLDIAPAPASLRWIHDVFGNCVAIARFAGRASELRFESTIRLEHSPDALNFEMMDYARNYPFSYSAEEMPDLLRSIERQYLDPEREIDRWARQFLRPNGPTPTQELLSAMTQTIRRQFTYVARHEAGTQDPISTLRLARGSCRDFALLMMEAVRSLGLAARFVSGYLHVPERPGRKRLGGGSTHAWLQVYLPGAGWVEFDPTNAIIGNHDLIRVAVARDPRQATPLSGTWTGFPSDCLGMEVEVNVTAEPVGYPSREPRLALTGSAASVS
ncbi:MAG: transglutaminase family protein [Alphaproteobacteria bacterium]|nr:transglutaminase family protein [Alphaproteobacteria bacterium]